MQSGNLAKYERAMAQMEKHITRNADGTFKLGIKSGKDIGVSPVIFADLTRSLEETNKKIREGDIKPADILPYSVVAKSGSKPAP